ncbi:hypothetical protein [Sporofaciens musculi]|uniref:hypothetical protein n=1 Tax=Sporofaciens musculi TaxID=2681861 RepID=UPI002ED4D196
MSRQIKDKEYASWIEGYTGDILLVGIHYDRKTKVHECMIKNIVFNYMEAAAYEGGYCNRFI